MDNENDDELLSNIFSNTSFVDDRSSNFKKEETLAKRQLQYRSLNSKEHEKRIRYFLDRQKEKRRSLLTHVRSLISLPVHQQENKSLQQYHQQENDIQQQQQQQKNSQQYIKQEDESQQLHHQQENNLQQQQQDNSNIDSYDILMDDNDNNNNKSIDKDNNNNNNNNDKHNNKKIYKKNKLDKKQKQILLYSNHLMLAEGMTYIPNDLEREWYCVPVPLGYRCLVISQNDNTVVRSENGEILFQFKSLLPFGSEKSRESASPANQHCILDCIYEESSGTFYILDILSWKGFILYDSETEFRFFWRDTKISEHISITNYSSSNSDYRFIAPPYFTSNSDSFQQIKFDKLLKHQLQQKENQQQDTQYGNQQQQQALQDNQILEYNTEFLLFYHKNSHYEFGTTPLFCSLSIDYIDMLMDHLNYKYQESQDSSGNSSDDNMN